MNDTGAPAGEALSTIFISYSHQDERWKKLLLPHLGTLQQAGHPLEVWEDRQIDGGSTWFPEITGAMERADVAVCLISPDYLASRFCVQEEVPFFLKRRAEVGLLLLPILLRPCQWKLFDWLKAIQMFPRDGKTVAIDFRDSWDIVFDEAAGTIHEFLESKRASVRSLISSFRPVPTTAVTGWPQSQWPALAPELIDLTRLPETGAALFGRQDELRRLDEVWASGGTRVMACVASGGVGKSTLANYWLRERMTPDHFRGARRVFGWTFYSQGTHTATTSADLFIQKALEFFGDPKREAGSPWDKGERLAHLAEGSLLVLDGLEPLQADFGADRGRVTDPALAGLLRAFTRGGSGMCLVTTREPLTELMHRRETVQTLDLDRLSPEAGRAVLRTGGVIGTDEELESLSRQFGPHALAITLLASWLHEQPGHRPAAAANLPELCELADAEFRPAHRVLAGFEQLLGEGPEIEILRILGLFDRPAKPEELRAVRSGDALPGLTEHVRMDFETNWQHALQRLRQLRLVAKESTHHPGVADAHPLIREHFGEQVRTRFPAAWKEGHSRLYEHLKQVAPELPNTLEEMMPLFAAVAHGCQAARHEEAFDDVYGPRICRRGDTFQVKKLGAFGADLAAISGFFERVWDQPVTGLSGWRRGWLQNTAGFHLRALGRLTEAVQPMRAGLDTSIAQKNWKQAARAAGNLGELSLVLGAVAEAEYYVRQSMDLADRSADAFMRVVNRAALADVLHQAGQLDEAEALFREAEAMQKGEEPKYPLLYSQRGYLYCDLLLTRAGLVPWLIWSASGGALAQSALGNRELAIQCCRDVQERAARTLEWEFGRLLDIALDHVSLGRAFLLERVLALDAQFLDPAFEHLNAAVDGLRRAGVQHRLVTGLVARAALRRVSGDPAGAAKDLVEAREIAERSGMKLFQVDCLIEEACQAIADCGSRIAGWKTKARECVAKAAKMVEETGYHRRDPEIRLLEQILADKS